MMAPYSEQSERAVLGCVLLDPANGPEEAMAAGISEESFYIPAARTTWVALVELRRQGGVADVLTLGEAMRTAGTLDQIGGQVWLERCCDAAVTPAHLRYYCKIVRDKELARGIIAVGQESSTMLADGEDPEQVRSKAEYRLSMLCQRAGGRRDLKAIVANAMETWEAAQKTGSAGIKTGFRIFDEFCGGLLPSAYIVISGKGGTGKTTLARNVAENVAMRGIPVTVFTLEQSAEQYAGATVARVAKQSVWKLNNGRRDCDFARLANAAGTVLGWPYRVDDEPHTGASLWSAARRAVGRYGARLLVVDYLQAVKDEQRRESDEARIASASAVCRDIAKELKITVIAVSALSNQGVLRGSGMIHYDCFTHVRLQTADSWGPDNLLYTATLEKQRFGPPGAVIGLRLLGDEQRFAEEGTSEEYEGGGMDVEDGE